MTSSTDPFRYREQLIRSCADCVTLRGSGVNRTAMLAVDTACAGGSVRPSGSGARALRVSGRGSTVRSQVGTRDRGGSLVDAELAASRNGPCGPVGRAIAGSPAQRGRTGRCDTGSAPRRGLLPRDPRLGSSDFHEHDRSVQSNADGLFGEKTGGERDRCEPRWRGFAARPRPDASRSGSEARGRRRAPEAEYPCAADPRGVGTAACDRPGRLDVAVPRVPLGRRDSGR